MISQPHYSVTLCKPSELSSAEQERCMALVREGSAIQNERYIQQNLPNAKALAVVRASNGEIVGFGALKASNPVHAKTVCNRSGHIFDYNMTELGYVAVDENHRGRKLSYIILDHLSATAKAPLYSTTDCPRMKKVLSSYGFSNEGKSWKGGRGELTLWLKESNPN